jgi:hypothetical protein
MKSLGAAYGAGRLCKASSVSYQINVRPACSICPAESVLVAQVQSYRRSLSLLSLEKMVGIRISGIIISSFSLTAE